MIFEHKPVMLDECIKHLNIKKDGVYIDATLGGAGHSQEIFKRLGRGGQLIGIDQDVNAITASGERMAAIESEGTFRAIKGNFRDLKDICEKNDIPYADGILLDVGVSSHQLDEAERGFSYQKDAPLDMRMDRTSKLDAMEIVNNYSEKEIGRIIRDYGEENWWARIAAFIVQERKKEEIRTTSRLVEVIKAAIPINARREGPHPAKRTFQALRIAVNDELGALEKATGDAISMLEKDGRLCIITFHSLEDRIVKNGFRAREITCTCPKDFPVCICGKIPEIKVITKKPILPSEQEQEENPRSRSAKLRVAQKL